MLRKIAISTALSIAFLAILFYAALSPMPVQAMRRESAIEPAKVEIVLSLDEALNRSLAYGDGRRVNWEAVGF